MEPRFSALLEDARRKKQITLRKLAQLVPLKPSVISEMEHGRRKPPKDEQTILSLAKVLDIPKEVLLQAARVERRVSSSKLSKRLQQINPNLAWGLSRVAEDASDKELEAVFSQALDRLQQKDIVDE